MPSPRKAARSTAAERRFCATSRRASWSRPKTTGCIRCCRLRCAAGRCARWSRLRPARADSVLDGIAVSSLRGRAGSLLAFGHAVKADVVAALPGAPADAALGYAQQTGIPFADVFVENRYAAGFFAACPTRPFSPVAAAVRGKRVVLVGDRADAEAVALLRACGAREVHLRVYVPVCSESCRVWRRAAAGQRRRRRGYGRVSVRETDPPSGRRTLHRLYGAGVRARPCVSPADFRLLRRKCGKRDFGVPFFPRRADRKQINNINNGKGCETNEKLQRELQGLRGGHHRGL